MRKDQRGLQRLTALILGWGLIYGWPWVWHVVGNAAVNDLAQRALPEAGGLDAPAGRPWPAKQQGRT
jgi:hypothetical protein